MSTLIREARKRRDGRTDYADRELPGRRLRVGSAADQDIQLEGVGIGPEHALIEVQSSGSELRCRGGRQVLVGGQPETRVPLVPDVEITLGTHKLRVIPSPPGIELALELEMGEGLKAAEFERTFTTRLEQTWLRRRPAAWISALLILVSCFVLPLFLALTRNAHHDAPATPARWLPSDRLWSAGPLIPAHSQAIGDNCGACHQKLFVPVRDGACSECHRTVHEHVTPEHLQLTRFARQTPSCESCHREHQDPPSAIIVRDNDLCLGCHARPAEAFGRLDIRTVTAFAQDRHPEFKVHLLKPVAGDPLAGTPDAEWRPVAFALQGAKESSNLKFSHQQHLDAARVSASTHEGGMACGDCHVPDADGFRFRPITMQNACISCHELTFDPLEPRRQLPHGKPREVVATLEEFYARRFLEPSSVPAPSFQRRATPGQDDKVDVTRCTDSATSCAQSAALRAVESQFKVRGCVSCHEVSDTRASEVTERFQVLAVRLGNQFYPLATFKHSSHLVQGDLKGDAACKSCHAAAKAGDSSVVLMPGIKQCLGCHTDLKTGTPSTAASEQHNAGASSRTTVPLGCIGCHRYHPATLNSQVTARSDASP